MWIHADISIRGYISCFLKYTRLLVCPPNSPIETPTPNVTALGGGAFARYVGYEGGALMRGVRIPVEAATERPSPSCRGEDAARSLRLGGESSPGHADPPDLQLAASVTERDDV